MKDVALSLLITAVVGVALGAAISIAFDVSFIKMFILVVVCQFIFFAIYNNYNIKSTRMKMEVELTKRYEAVSKQTLQVNCASCNASNEHILDLNGDNDFTCTECGIGNAIYINVTTAQKTTPLRTNSLQVKTLIQDELEAREKFN